MARTLVDEVQAHNRTGEMTRAIIPCGPSGWYPYFAEMVNSEQVSLQNLVVFHMDECLDWQGRELPHGHPYNFRAFMEENFYAPVENSLNVLEENAKRK
jgi:glucosamine-6-phosphate deaminase